MQAPDASEPNEPGELQLAARARQGADWIAAAMFAAVFLIFNYKIFTRYFEHNEAVWADEVLVILFIWIIFWAQAFVVRDKDQITFDLVYRLLPARGQRVAALLRHGLIGGVFLWSLPGSLGYIRFLWREHTPVLNLPLDAVYSCFGLFLIAVIVRSFFSAKRLLGPRWSNEI
ncbi:MAG TPA: TRAP transporter small permease [Xanthobacteraceae bacterium]|jgi:TRAP-type C4-dicarboxylate transport system permease small subunit|nr:TRAP transporter small permease [Xanthobacteraceae bacterium]